MKDLTKKISSAFQGSPKKKPINTNDDATDPNTPEHTCLCGSQKHILIAHSGAVKSSSKRNRKYRIATIDDPNEQGQIKAPVAEIENTKTEIQGLQTKVADYHKKCREARKHLTDSDAFIETYHVTYTDLQKLLLLILDALHPLQEGREAALPPSEIIKKIKSEWDKNFQKEPPFWEAKKEKQEINKLKEELDSLKEQINQCKTKDDVLKKNVILQSEYLEQIIEGIKKSYDKINHEYSLYEESRPALILKQTHFLMETKRLAPLLLKFYVTANKFSMIEPIPLLKKWKKNPRTSSDNINHKDYFDILTDPQFSEINILFQNQLTRSQNNNEIKKICTDLLSRIHVSLEKINTLFSDISDIFKRSTLAAMPLLVIDLNSEIATIENGIADKQKAIELQENKNIRNIEEYEETHGRILENARLYGEDRLNVLENTLSKYSTALVCYANIGHYCEKIKDLKIECESLLQAKLASLRSRTENLKNKLDQQLKKFLEIRPHLEDYFLSVQTEIKANTRKTEKIKKIQSSHRLFSWSHKRTLKELQAGLEIRLPTLKKDQEKEFIDILHVQEEKGLISKENTGLHHHAYKKLMGSLMACHWQIINYIEKLILCLCHFILRLCSHLPYPGKTEKKQKVIVSYKKTHLFPINIEPLAFKKELKV